MSDALTVVEKVFFTVVGNLLAFLVAYTSQKTRYITDEIFCEQASDIASFNSLPG
jgi:hypothetical protein